MSTEKPELDLDDLELELVSIPVRAGRQALPLQMEYSKDLTPAMLATPSPITQKAPPLVKIRDSHHALARVLATGSGEAEASMITGFSASRISILKADPQFADLLEFYRSQGTEAVADYKERMINVGLDALNILQERMEEKPEDFSPGLLKDIAKDMADRTGHAPQRGPSNVTQINIGLSDRMARARERVQENSLKANETPKVIDHE